MQFGFLLEQVVNGLVLGGYYLLIALGLSLIFSVGGIVNLAHGAFYALGAYVCVELTKRLGFGVSMVAEQAIRMIWGAAPVSTEIPQSFRGSVFVGDFLFSRYRLLILAVVATIMVGVWLLLHKTSFGRVVRAGIQRPDMVAAL